VVLAGTSLNRPADEAAAHVLSGFARLGVHPDVPEGVRILRRQGLRGEFERLLSVEDAAAWKPVPAAYAHTARACSVSMEQMLLVAVHPWDIHGAHQAGMRTGWIARQQTPYPDYFAAPDLQAQGLAALAEHVVS
jgi:2-haloacid dehalogenase